ncbi:MAG: ATP-binding protein [Bacilli bacterium]
MNEQFVETLIAAGEGYRIEFKESMDKSLVEEVTAFANASGGTILIGVRDNGQRKGVDTSNVTRSRLQDIIRQIKPTLDVEVHVVGTLLIVSVPEGRNKPYACSRGFFMRMGANAQKLDRDDILELFQSEGRMRFDELLARSVNADKDVSEEAFGHFMQLSGMQPVLSVEDHIINVGAGERDDRFYLNWAGVLFFTEQPSKWLKHANIVCALYKGTDKMHILDKKDASGTIITMIEETMLFLKKHLRVRYEIEETRRRTILEIPEVALREAVINAICHRDYFERGAQVMVEIFDDRVVISNPGGLTKGVSTKTFGRVSVARNPIIASLLQRSKYIEKMGTGVVRMRQAMRGAVLPPPLFEMDRFFIVTLMRPLPGGEMKQSIALTAQLTQLDADVLQLLRIQPKLTAASLAMQLDCSPRTIERHIAKLKQDGLLFREGSNAKGVWRVQQTGHGVYE